MNFGTGRLRDDEYPSHYYEEFLEHVKSCYEGQFWHALPGKVADFWKNRSSGAGQDKQNDTSPALTELEKEYNPRTCL
jgi:hypothetical protein